mgnify:CR=1 FL=1
MIIVSNTNTKMLNNKNGARNEIGDTIQATVTIKNDNYKGFTTKKVNNQTTTVQNVKVQASKILKSPQKHWLTA